MRWRRARSGLAILVTVGLFVLLARGIWQQRLAAAVDFALLPTSFAALPGWHADDHGAALAAFRKSCARRSALPDARTLLPQDVAGQVGDRRVACRAARALEPQDRAAARAFFERHFTPFAVVAHGRREGLFTGYYEPLVDADVTPSADYPIPLYRRPPELVTADLGDFAPDLAGRRIAGAVIAGRLRPFATRAEIESGALAGRGLELLWAADPVAVFFLQIQGSGRARLPDGRVLRLAYDGRNGHPYTSLGRLLVARGALHPSLVSAPAIASWLRANPVIGAELMRENASYVFFRLAEGDGTLGAEGVPLTPGRSLAVDRRFIPLGTPLWLATTQPDPEAPAGRRLPLRRLVVAQDSGAAIRGAVRGDLYWGFGAEAETIAGYMADRGRLWLLLPKPLAARATASGGAPS